MDHPEPLDLHVELVVADPWDAGREMLCSQLRRGGHAVDSAADAATAARLVRARTPEVALVDARIAEVDDWQLVGRLRELCAAPATVVVLGPDSERLMLRALRRGADDYLVKPVPARELLARVGAHLRLLRRLGGAPAASGEAFGDGPLAIHPALRRVELDGRPVDLTPLEYRLLLALVRHRDKVLSRDELSEMAWHGSAGGGCEHVKLYVHYLRRKLAAHTPADPIRTVRGHGYQWAGFERRASHERRSAAE